jgi:tetratricopeptide (TPR) repeat protein
MHDDQSDDIPPLELASRLLVEAKALARQGQYEAAVKLLRRATEVAPTCREAWRELFDMLKKLRWYDDALEACAEAGEHMPEDRAMWLFTEANLLNDLGEYELANEAIDKTLAIRDGSDFLWSFKAMILKNWGHFAEAIEAADRALAINPRDHAAMGMKAISLEVLGHEEEAKVLREQEHEAFLEWRAAEERKERLSRKPIAEA